MTAWAEVVSNWQPEVSPAFIVVPRRLRYPFIMDPMYFVEFVQPDPEKSELGCDLHLTVHKYIRIFALRAASGFCKLVGVYNAAILAEMREHADCRVIAPVASDCDPGDISARAVHF